LEKNNWNAQKNYKGGGEWENDLNQLPKQCSESATSKEKIDSRIKK
jgi:hypothetical protein